MAAVDPHDRPPWPILLQILERAMGIGPTSSVWKTEALPLSYARLKTKKDPKALSGLGLFLAENQHQAKYDGDNADEGGGGVLFSVTGEITEKIGRFAGFCRGFSCGLGGFGFTFGGHVGLLLFD